SGGELSRVMLAIEVVFAGAGGPPTLVFDEVDAGVGGRAAVEVGRRLARLARNHQVLVVTHLPQVAAFADHHLVVAKDPGGAVTTSGVRVVEATDRARELARMLAGLPDSDLGIAHAEELLAVAGREKSGGRVWPASTGEPGCRGAGHRRSGRGPGHAELCGVGWSAGISSVTDGYRGTPADTVARPCQADGDAPTVPTPYPQLRAGRPDRHRAAGPPHQAPGGPA